MNIDKLKKVIQEANPEIMELKEGCYFSGEGVSNGLIVRMISRSPLGFVAEYHHKGFGIVYKELGIRKIEIHGRDIRLADVLLAIIKTCPPAFSQEVCLGTEGAIKVIAIWSLKDNNLDNQSDELYKLLIKLLVKDNE